MDLEYVVKICFEPGAVLEDFVLVTGDFEALLAFLETNERDIGEAYYVGWLRDVFSKSSNQSLYQYGERRLPD